MRLLVTGASGFLGSRLIPELSAQGHFGLAVSRRKIGELPAGWDWRERGSVLSAPPSAPPDALIHLEVKQHVPNPTPADLREFDSVNVGGVKSWLDWCAQAQVNRFIHLSTIKAVADSPEIQLDDAASPPSTLYGQSKRAGEDLVAAWGRESPARSVLILRPAVVYGPGNTANIFSFIQAIDCRRFFLVGGSRNLKSLVSLRNAAAAITFLLVRMRPGVDYFNLTDQESFSVRELAEKLARLLGKNPRFASIPLFAARLAALAGDLVLKATGRSLPLTTSRLSALTETTHFSCRKLLAAGFRHPQTTDEGFQEMIAWRRTLPPAS